MRLNPIGYIDARTEEIEFKLKLRYPKGQPVAAIGQYRFTCHALARGIARQIPGEWIREALRLPPEPETKHVIRYDGPRATVWVNPLTKWVITVGYGHENAPTWLRLAA